MAKIELTRQDTRVINLTVKDSDGTAYDLTGATVFFTVNDEKEPSTDSGALIQKDVTSHSDPTNGITTITLTNTDTDVTPGNHYYDIQVKDSSNNIFSLERDRCKIVGDITRRTS